jgi:hypothetical protein
MDPQEPQPGGGGGAPRRRRRPRLHQPPPPCSSIGSGDGKRRRTCGPAELHGVWAAAAPQRRTAGATSFSFPLLRSLVCLAPPLPLGGGSQLPRLMREGMCISHWKRVFFERVSSLSLLHSGVLQHEDSERCWSRSKPCKYMRIEQTWPVIIKIIIPARNLYIHVPIHTFIITHFLLI